MKRFFLFFSIILALAAVIFVASSRFFTTEKITVLAPTQHNAVEVSYPKAGQMISSPLTIMGVVTSSSWTGFEGQVGSVKLVDDKGTELASGPLTATTEWTQLPTSFRTTLSFTHVGGGAGKLIFHNENASGMPEKDKTFELPINFATPN